ncbi:MAG: hypothetical protein KME26_14800 [Oscillatoria princeps RMCB-10]|nr:hypothetical protein [Oscillatoria princeps RMCB-10]
MKLPPATITAANAALARRDRPNSLSQYAEVRSPQAALSAQGAGLVHY